MFKKHLIKRYLAEPTSSSRTEDNGETMEVVYNPETLVDITKKVIQRNCIEETTTKQRDDVASYKIISDTKKQNKKYKMERREVVFKIRELSEDESNPIELIRNSIEDIIDYITKNVPPHHKIGLEFKSDKFNNAAWLKFKWARDLTFEDVWNVLSGVFQSNSEGLNTDSFNIVITQITCPTGQAPGHPRTNAYNTFIEEWSRRKGIIYVDNKDNLCLPRAIVIAKVYAENGTRREKDVIRRNIGKQQDVKVRELLENSGVVIPAEGGGIEELRKFQQYLSGYKLSVYTAGTKGRELIYEGPKAPLKINLVHSNNHYSVITSLTAAFVCGYYCEDCHVPYQTKNRHQCKAACSFCLVKPSCQLTTKILCRECNRDFVNETCFAQHITNGVCKKLRRCNKCHRTVNQNRVHHCNEMFCSICKTHVPENHLCYIQQDVKQPQFEFNLFIFFDLETRQEKNYRDNDATTKIHQPNLCVLHQRCYKCIDVNDMNTCATCGYRQKIFPPESDVIGDFMQYVLNLRSKFKKIVVIAHNGQAFDHQFILKYLLEKTSHKPELIMRGSKIILMNIDRVRFIDSLNYFPMPLSSLPSAFDLPSIFKKGYFPHLFNTLENKKYVGRVPDMKFYNPDTMKICDDCADTCSKHGCRNNFLKWYRDQENCEFKFEKELLEYCISDVQIHTLACLKFRKIMIEECNVCPFTEATTIASTCNLVFRRKFLKPSTIGVIPKNGYRNVDTQSKIAVKWLIEEETKRKIKIKHAFNGREVVINGMKVDGYAEATRQIFEFHGCYYHGHECFLFNRDKPIHQDINDTLNSRRQRTTDKTERLRELGYEVIEMWQCDYNTTVSDKHPMLQKLPLNPRDAFYGGRTGNTRSYYKAKPGEKINYIDVCSLYPWVCKYQKYPIGHPEILIGEECNGVDIKQTDGLIKCMILPPKVLYHPVLPVKMNNKLMFVLCLSCGEKNLKQCDHTDDERILTGTWVIDEVLKALEKGYTLVKIYEIWRYKTIQQGPLTEGLFSNFINKFLKIKQQASGWPSHITNQLQKDAYISDYMQQEGIELEENKIVKNAGLRSVAKIMLNSFWGKFGQRENQAKTSIVRTSKELYDILINPAIDTNAVQEVNDDVVIVNWEYKSEAAEMLSSVNVCIAAYTTTHARLKLYSYLEQLGNRVLYYDTDSVIYISAEGSNDPATGSFLGDMTDELESEYGVGSYITEFISGGPKNYGYEVFSTAKNKLLGKCKVKGFSLNYNASKLINLASMRNSIIGENTAIPITSCNIRRTKQHDVISTTESKNYRATNLKRVFQDDYDSLPYGHKKLCYT